MHFLRRFLCVGASAALLASMVATLAAPTVVASTSVIPGGDIPLGGTSTGTATFAFVENSMGAFTGPGSLTVTILDYAGGSTLTMSGGSLAAPGSLGASLSASGSSFTITTSSSDPVNIEGMWVSEVVISASASAATGPVQANLSGSLAGAVAEEGQVTLASPGTVVTKVAPGQARLPKTLRITTDTTLSANFAGSVVIAKDGVTLDCAGHRITGTGAEKGVYVANRKGVTVKNCDVSNFATGFWVSSTSGSTFEGNRSHDNRPTNGVAGMVIGAGFWLQNASGNTFLYNTMSSNPSDGLSAFNSSNNLFVSNDTTSNGMAGFFFGDNSIGNTVSANTAVGNGASGFIIADGASDNTLSDNFAYGNLDYGFSIDGNMHPSTGNVLEANGSVGNSGGFIVNRDAVDNVLTANYAALNSVAGFVIAAGASGNSVSMNDGSNNSEFGFAIVDRASSNILTANTACGNPIWDAYEDGTGTGNEWTDNAFCTSAGFPPGPTPTPTPTPTPIPTPTPAPTPSATPTPLPTP